MTLMMARMREMVRNPRRGRWVLTEDRAKDRRVRVAVAVVAAVVVAGVEAVEVVEAIVLGRRLPLSPGVD